MQPKTPYLSPKFATYVQDFLLDRGIEPSEFFDIEEFPHKNVQELSPAINIDYVADMFEIVSKKLDKPLFGLELAQGFHFDSSSMIILAMLSAKNASGLLETLLKYDKYVDTAISLEFTIINNEGCLSLELLSPEGTNTAQISLFLVFLLLLSLQRATRTIPKVNKICLVDQFNSDDIKQKVDLRNTKFERSINKNYIFFDLQYLKTKLNSHNELLHEVICTALDKYYSYRSGRCDIIDIVSREILIQNKTSLPTIITIARALNMSERSLRRLLSEHDITFKELKSEVFLQRASYYLEYTNMTISQIAYELGYSEPSSFNRAFKSYCDQTPDVFRKKNSNIN